MITIDDIITERNAKVALLILAAAPLVIIAVVSALPFLLSAWGLRKLSLVDYSWYEKSFDG